MGAGLEQWQTCVPIEARFRADWQAGSVALTAPSGAIAWTQSVDVLGEDLLLPGEGVQFLDIDDGGPAVPVAVVAGPSQTRDRASVRVAPAWTGPPGAKRWRWRLRGTHRGISSTGPWTPEAIWQLQEPQSLLAPGSVSRGNSLPLALHGVPTGSQLVWAGKWTLADGSAQVWPADVGAALPVAQDNVAIASSLWWLSRWPATGPQPVAFDGTLHLRVLVGGQAWAGSPVPVQWQVATLQQRVVIICGTGWLAALQRLGLAAHSQAIEDQMLAVLRGHFTGLAVTLGTAPVAGEALYLTFFDKDPNGLGLLGVEPGVVKDVGNLQLDEQLGGLNHTARKAGYAAYGGVFLGEALGFSAKLHPHSPVATPQFDELFGATAPSLGGTAAPAGAAGPATFAAGTALAHVAAEIAAHEIGHALGLAAATAAPHHAGDHPGWIMDAGVDRPFAERAGLAGATQSTWGPIDTAYLHAVLAKSKP